MRCSIVYVENNGVVKMSKEKHVGTTIDSDLHQAFSLAVIAKGTSKTKVLRQAIKKYVQENRKEKEN